MSLNLSVTPLRLSASTIRQKALPTSAKSSSTPTFICSQCRHATLLRRPRRPYTFTQLIILSDGSTFTHRTSSPVPVYLSTRDTRNAPLWNPSSAKLANVETDEAGRLAAFRNRFGTSWDAASPVDPSASADGTTEESASTAANDLYDMEDDNQDDNMLDLISSFGQDGGKKN